MGSEIPEIQFSDVEFDQYKQRLRKETALLASWFKNGSLQNQGKTIGLELETWLVDHNHIPSACNETFLKDLNHPLVVPELSKFNTEVNADPCQVDTNVLTQLFGQISDLWKLIQQASSKCQKKMLLMGTLPTLKNDMLNLDSMSDLERYRAVNQQILKLRKGKPLRLDIKGREDLDVSHDDIMLEAAGTSLQIHLQSEPDKAHSYHNAALIASAAIVAICANSPFLFGQDLWDETRIAVFEKSLSLPGFQNIDGDIIRRVTFGSGYVRRSLLECFLENLDSFPILLTVIYDDEIDKLCHLRLHNGTIWRWNRPIVSRDNTGFCSVRTEHRTPAAGPSIVDVIGNIAFYLGVVEGITAMEKHAEDLLPFKKAHDNFYAAAKWGLDASVHWFGGKTMRLSELCQEELLPLAKSGLERLNIDQSDIDFFLCEVIGERIKSRQTGASWQRAFVAKHGKNFPELIKEYFNNQESGKAVYQWRV